MAAFLDYHSRTSAKNLVLDIGGVLLKWDAVGVSGLGGFMDPKLLSHMLQDSIWNAYETGTLTSDQAYNQLCLKYAVPVENIRSAIDHAKKTLRPVPEIMRIVNEYRGKLRLFCMTNIPGEEFEYIHKAFPDVWQGFEKIFTSAAVGMRKPNLEFFRHVLREGNLSAKETIFVDDTQQNCVAAKSLGINTVLCECVESAVQNLTYILRSEEDRLSAARGYLDKVLEQEDHKDDLYTYSIKGAGFSDDFSKFLIADVLNDERFLPMDSVPANGELTYSRDTNLDKCLLHPLPSDLDTTSNGMSVLFAMNKVDLEFVRSVVIENMLNYVSEDGILQTYFDRSRPRTCHVVLANTILLFHIAGRLPPAPTLQFVYNVLLNKAYLEGSQYYVGPAPFLFFLSRTAARFRENHYFASDFVPLLGAAVRELMGTQSNVLVLAQIILACLNLGIYPDVRDIERLARAQNVDGSWNASYWVKGNCHVFGNKALTTAFALRALERFRELESSDMCTGNLVHK